MVYIQAHRANRRHCRPFFPSLRADAGCNHTKYTCSTSCGRFRRHVLQGMIVFSVVCVTVSSPDVSRSWYNSVLARGGIGKGIGLSRFPSSREQGSFFMSHFATTGWEPLDHDRTLPDQNPICHHITRSSSSATMESARPARTQGPQIDKQTAYGTEIVFSRTRLFGVNGTSLQ